MKQRVGLASVLAVLAAPAWAEDQSADFLNMSLQDVVDMEVTSVSKKSEKASEAAAAIYVITNEDIRRTGATNLAEVLRLAPGLHVARSGSSQWAVSARGFNDQFANKLLVLMDGRTIYSPTFSGVWWDLHNPIMEDIERIEIIRGPGATVWGANAVNGVINIITRSAEDSQGSLLTAGAGNQTEVNTNIRHGFKLSDTAWARIYAAFEEYDEVKQAGGALGNHDEWGTKRAGFRVDWDATLQDNLTFQGDVYQGHRDQRYMLPVTTAPYTSTTLDDHEVYGANILGRWKKQISERSGITLQSYIDFNHRDIVVHDNNELTFDIDFQHVYDMNDRNTLTWGMGYRYIDDHLSNNFVLDYSPDSFDRHLFSGFFQHKLALVPDEVFLTFGSKFEHNDYTHFEHQPSARLSWLVDEHQTVWGAVSHAVRTPDRSNDDIINPLTAFPSTGGLTGVLVRTGSNTVESERLTAYEAGYRIQPTDDWAVDVSVFFNDYENLIANQTGTPALVSSGVGAPYISVPLIQTNAGEGYSYGGELVVNWQALDNWNLEAHYSVIDVELKSGTSSVNTENKSPQHQFKIHSNIDLPHDLEFDQYLSYTDSVATNSSAWVDDYWGLNMRLGWKPLEHVELSLSANNLLDDDHSEYGPFLYNTQTEIGRSVYGQITLRF